MQKVHQSNKRMMALKVHILCNGVITRSYKASSLSLWRRSPWMLVVICLQSPTLFSSISQTVTKPLESAQTNLVPVVSQARQVAALSKEVIRHASHGVFRSKQYTWLPQLAWACSPPVSSVEQVNRSVFWEETVQRECPSCNQSGDFLREDCGLYEVNIKSITRQGT